MKSPQRFVHPNPSHIKLNVSPVSGLRFCTGVGSEKARESSIAFSKGLSSRQFLSYGFLNLKYSPLGSQIGVMSDGKKYACLGSSAVLKYSFTWLNHPHYLPQAMAGHTIRSIYFLCLKGVIKIRLKLSKHLFKVL